MISNAMNSTAIARFWQRVERVDDDTSCWIWTGTKSSTGYGVVRIGGKLQKAHRIAFGLARGFPVQPNGFLCHRCDTPLCVRPDHLFIGDAQTNMTDAHRKGRLLSKQTGKLTPEQRDEAARRYVSGERLNDVAAAFGVSKNSIRQFCRARRLKRSARVELMAKNRAHRRRRLPGEVTGPRN